MVGTGIALGVYSNNKLFTGAKGFAGEVGYAYVPYKNKLERFDNLSSGRIILEKSKTTPKELIKRINENCEKSIKIIKEAGHYFGVLLGLVIQFYNPDIIVVGGTTKTYPYYMKEALKTVKKTTLQQSYDSVIIKEPKDFENIVAKWALLYDLNNFNKLL